jgi:hypothetical protein
MTWFAGNRCTPQTPVIRRLLGGRAGEGGEGGKKGSEGGGSERDPILLFCRLTGEPYVFLGRVRPHKSDVSRHPIRVVWDLVDFERMKDTPGFKEIVGHGAGKSEG